MTVESVMGNARGSGVEATERDPAADALMARVRGVLLLSGQVGSTPLLEALTRSVVDLPVSADRRVIDIWQQEVTAVAEQHDLAHLPLRVLVNHRAANPAPPVPSQRVLTQVEQDAGEFRGTAGAIRDAAADYGDDDWLLVASGGQLLVRSLAPIVDALCQQPGDVRLLVHSDGTPTTLMLVRCGVLNEVPRVGFVDFKEQALPRIAESHRVQVLQQREPVGMPVRMRDDYLQALYRYHGPARDGAQFNPFMETWQRTFSVIEPGAVVSDSARIHDAVILDGAHVEAGAVVSRSVVCDRARVTRNRRVVERVVPGPRRAGSDADG